MEPVFVISQTGKKLMPTTKYGWVNHVLKDKKAKIVNRHPFTIQLQYKTKEYTQPLELTVDSGYNYVGVSLKSENREFYSAEYELLKDEKDKHEKCKKMRRERRNRLWYRKPRWQNRISTKPKGWIAPSLQHKVDAQVQIVERICKVSPVCSVTVEVGEFDPALLVSMQTSGIPLEGTDYQHGPLYYADNLRSAVFQRDNYTCQICGESALKNNNIHLCMHHALYWQGRHANTLNECITVCSHCHTQANHQENGKLWGLKPNVPRLEGAAYMNIVRWKLIDTLKENLPNIEIIHTYGSITSRTRKNLGLEKTHANDAYCIGKFFPKKRAETVYFEKIRRNNRCLEKFIDAKYIDTRTGKKVSAKDLSCGRTNRRESRNSEKNLRIFRGQKISKGRRNIRRSTYEIKSGDIVIYNNQKYLSHGIINKGEYVVLDSVKNVDIKDIKDVKSLEIGKYVQWQNQKTKRKILDINGDIITLQWNISVPNNPEYVKRFVKKDGWVKIKKNQKSKTKQPKINDSITKPLKTNNIIKKYEVKIQKIQLSLFDI